MLRISPGKSRKRKVARETGVLSEVVGETGMFSRRLLAEHSSLFGRRYVC